MRCCQEKVILLTGPVTTVFGDYWCSEHWVWSQTWSPSSFLYPLDWLYYLGFSLFGSYGPCLQIERKTISLGFWVDSVKYFMGSSWHRVCTCYCGDSADADVTIAGGDATLPRCPIFHDSFITAEELIPLYMWNYNHPNSHTKHIKTVNDKNSNFKTCHMHIFSLP